MRTGKNTYTKGIGLIFALFASSALAQPTINNVKGKVTKIVDGDTAWVEVNSKRLTIRVIGIDTPETHLVAKGEGVVSQGHWGTDAADYFANILPVGKSVTLEDHGFDAYKRTLGRIFVGARDMNLEMVKSGWAIPYIICEGDNCDEDFFQREHVEDYLEACDNARAKGLGIFNPNDLLEEMPFEFRLRMGHRQPDKWVGDYYTNKLVAPADYDEVDLCSRIFFMRKGDAEAVGFEE